MKTTKTLKRLLLHTGGNILIISALALPVLVLGIGVAVDLNQYMKASDYVQHAVDQAALGATSVDRNATANPLLPTRKAVAESFYYASLSTDVAEHIASNKLNVVEEFPDGGDLTVAVTATVTMKSQFGGIIGIDGVTFEKHSKALREVKDVEAVFTYAASGSMCADKERIDDVKDIVPGDVLIKLNPNTECPHFYATMNGLQIFSDIIQQNETIADFKFGLVPYNHKVIMPDPMNIPPSMSANEEVDYFRLIPEFLSPVVPLTSNTADISTMITSTEEPFEARVWSRSDLGSHTAGLMLDPEHHEYFGGDVPVPFKTEGTEKVMILMTDGVNSGCCFTNHPQMDWSNQYVYHYQPYNDEQIEICAALEAQGVDIFTILLDVELSDPGGEEIQNTFARCAKGTSEKEQDPEYMSTCDSRPMCYNVANDEELVKAFQQIAQRYYKPTIIE